MAVSIVLPVYDEGPAVVPVLRGLEQAVHSTHEILVVYDYDADPTVPAVTAVLGELPTVRLLRNELGRGVLNAMKAGIDACAAPYVVISMADGSDEPSVIDRMVALAQGGADVVAAGPVACRGRPATRRAAGQARAPESGRASRSIRCRPACRSTIRPATSSSTAAPSLTRSLIESGAGFELALELSLEATLAHRRLAEVPTTWRDRTSGASHFKLRAWLPHYLRWYLAAFRGRWRPKAALPC